MPLLTVAIPTYNRKKQLIQTLKNLEAQTNQNFDIVISDNNSSYDVIKAIEDNFSGTFYNKITLYRRSVNVGGDNNIIGLFEHVNSGWLWIVSDDDYEVPTAINTIYSYIKDNSDFAVIQFSFFKYLDKPVNISNIDDYISLLYNKVSKRTGQLICGDFSSALNKVYNVNLLTREIEDAFCFSNCCMTTGIIMLNALKHNKKVHICFDNIIEFGPNFWSIKKVALAACAIGNIDFNITTQQQRRLLYIINLPYRMPLHYWLLPDNHDDDFIEKLYYGFYRYHLPFKEKMDFYIRMKVFSVGFVYKLHLWISKLEHKLKFKKNEQKMY